VFIRPVFPSPVAPRMERGPLGLNPSASHPAVTSDARPGGDRPRNTGPELHFQHRVDLQSCVFTRDVRPRVAPRIPVVRGSMAGPSDPQARTTPRVTFLPSGRTPAVHRGLFWPTWLGLDDRGHVEVAAGPLHSVVFGVSAAVDRPYRRSDPAHSQRRDQVAGPSSSQVASPQHAFPHRAANTRGRRSRSRLSRPTARRRNGTARLSSASGRRRWGVPGPRP
jgi:hypothetical protein